jgi:hypothetical protein
MDIVNEITPNIKTDIGKLKAKLQTFNNSFTESVYKKENSTLSYVNLSNDFVKEYTTSNFVQYSHLYFIRLTEIKTDIVKLATKKWPNVKICKNLLDVKGKVKFKFTA